MILYIDEIGEEVGSGRGRKRKRETEGEEEPEKEMFARLGAVRHAFTNASNNQALPSTGFG